MEEINVVDGNMLISDDPGPLDSARAPRDKKLSDYELAQLSVVRTLNATESTRFVLAKALVANYNRQWAAGSYVVLGATVQLNGSLIFSRELTMTSDHLNAPVQQQPTAGGVATTAPADSHATSAQDGSTVLYSPSQFIPASLGSAKKAPGSYTDRHDLVRQKPKAQRGDLFEGNALTLLEDSSKDRTGKSAYVGLRPQLIYSGTVAYEGVKEGNESFSLTPITVRLNLLFRGEALIFLDLILPQIEQGNRSRVLRLDAKGRLLLTNLPTSLSKKKYANFSQYNYNEDNLNYVNLVPETPTEIFVKPEIVKKRFIEGDYRLGCFRTDAAAELLQDDITATLAEVYNSISSELNVDLVSPFQDVNFCHEDFDTTDRMLLHAKRFAELSKKSYMVNQSITAYDPFFFAQSMMEKQWHELIEEFTFSNYNYCVAKRDVDNNHDKTLDKLANEWISDDLSRFLNLKELKDDYYRSIMNQNIVYNLRLEDPKKELYVNSKALSQAVGEGSNHKMTVNYKLLNGINKNIPEDGIKEPYKNLKKAIRDLGLIGFDLSTSAPPSDQAPQGAVEPSDQAPQGAVEPSDQAPQGAVETYYSWIAGEGVLDGAPKLFVKEAEEGQVNYDLRGTLNDYQKVTVVLFRDRKQLVLNEFYQDLREKIRVVPDVDPSDYDPRQFKDDVRNLVASLFTATYEKRRLDRDTVVLNRNEVKRRALFKRKDCMQKLKQIDRGRVAQYLNFLSKGTAS